MLCHSLRTRLTQTAGGKTNIRKSRSVAQKISDDSTSLRILMFCIYLQYSELS